MSSKLKTLPAYKLAQIAGHALIDVRTVQHYLQGKRTLRSTGARIRQAAQALGIDLPAVEVQP